MSGGGHSKGNPYVQATIVLLLLLIVVPLHQLTGTEHLDAGIAALLAFGFVVLASYTIGKLVDVIFLPHITGYLLAGVLFGPSVAHLLSDWVSHADLGFTIPPPFDRGILFTGEGDEPGTIEALSLLDTLAVALIAMTAGGELKLDGLRKGLKAIMGVLVGQTVALMVMVTAGFTLAAPLLFASLGLETPPLPATIALGLVVASVSVATSPAATIAVVNESSADGPMTRTLLSTVVLKDVVVVVAYSIASALAGGALGLSVNDDLLGFLAVHIGGSLVVGAVLGGALSLYLRFVGREILLLIIGVVYTATALAGSYHLDPVLVFIAAGFTVSNFSREGDTLIHNVERLSMPVYVVFFTLAGAKLHLDEVFKVAAFALGLVALRAFATWLGIRVGGQLGGADENTTKKSWLGFLSQAGVAITLAAKAGETLGEAGRAVQTLLIAGVAVNELIGPVLLQRSLRSSGEAGQKGSFRDTQAPAKGPAGGDPDSADSETVKSWPPPESTEPWGEPSTFSDEGLTKHLDTLRASLEGIVAGAAKGPIRRAHIDKESFLRDIRREFLRVHRRVSVRLRDQPEESLAPLLHLEQSNLSQHWRAVVLGRANRVGTSSWSPADLVEKLDAICERLPEWVHADYEPRSFAQVEGQSIWRSIRRLALRARRGFARLFRQDLKRRVPLRALVRYHLAGATPVRLRELATLLVRAELHLLSRTREMTERVFGAYERSVGSGMEAEDLNLELKGLREALEEDLERVGREVEHIAREKTHTLVTIFSESLAELALDLEVAGTLDLSARNRRSSQVFHQRLEAIGVLSDELDDSRRALGGSYRLLAMDLELLALEAQVREVLTDQGGQISRSVRGRAFVQAERVDTALAEALVAIEDELEHSEHIGDVMAATVRQLTEPVLKTLDEATATVSQLYDQLADENILAPLFDALRRAAQPVAESYDVPARPVTLAEDADNLATARVPLVEIPFRELVSGYLEGAIAPSLAGTVRDLATRVQPLLASLEELEGLIEFKLELATAELDAVLDESVGDDATKVLREMLIAGLERNREVLRGHVEQAAAWPDELDAKLTRNAVDGIVELRGKLLRGELSQLRVEALRRRAAGMKLLSGAEELRSASRIRAALIRATRGVVGADRLDEWWRFFGLPIEEQGPPRAADFAAADTPADLPLVYRRLFAADALDLRSTRENELQRARTALGAKGNVLRTVAFVGPEGAGKGALLRAVIRSRGWKSVRRIVLDRPTSVETVESWFAERQDGQLLVLSGFQWLVSMRPGGFEPLRRFVDGIVQDHGRCGWVVSADELVWRVAAQVVPASEAFGEIIEVAPLSAEELEAVVLARHRLSSYGLSFEPTRNDTALEAFVARGAGRIRRPYEAFFQALHDSSGGLVREALRLWLASVEEVDEGDGFVRVGAPPQSPQPALRRLPSTVVLSLYQVARQGWSDAECHAHLFRITASAAEAQLARLTHLGLLVRGPEQTYVIAPHLRGPVYRHLVQRGWI